MDKQKAKILFDLSKSSSNEKVIHGLREIKKRLLSNIKNLEVFRRLGLVSHIIKLVQRPNEDILNGGLSILSILSAYENTRSEVFAVGGVPPLIVILRCAQGESLQQRATRTIANQAQHVASCQEFFRLNILTHIQEVMENCENEDTKISAIRALRLLGKSGSNCQKIIEAKGITQVCTVGFGVPGDSPSEELIRATLKTLVHFSRVHHPICVKQMMFSTKNLAVVTKFAESEDAEIYNMVFTILLNVMKPCVAPERSCAAFNQVFLDEILSILCWKANAPTLLAKELKEPRDTSICRKTVLLSLCKLCEVPGDPSTIEHMSSPGLALTKLAQCDAIPLLISLLSEHRQEPKLRTALLKALVGVEHCYSGKDLVLKHYLAAKILPQLTEQFDEIMSEYRNIRRPHIKEQCVHSVISTTVKMETESEETPDEKKKSGQAPISQEIDCEDKNSISKSEENIPKNSGLPDSDSSHRIKTEFKTQADLTENSKEIKKENLQNENDNFELEKNTNVHEMKSLNIASTSKAAIKISFNESGTWENSEDSKLEVGNSQSNSGPFVGSVTKKLLNLQQLSSGVSFPHLSVKSFESKLKLNEASSSSSNSEGTYSNLPKSSGSNSPQIGYNPKSPGSLSCSPRSYYSSSPSNSPSCSPPHPRSDSPTFSPPFFSASYVSPPHNLPPWNFDSSPPGTSPSSSSRLSSPPYNMSSPPRSTSPIKVPSDWEYEDEDDNIDEESQDKEGRFSPTVPDIEALEGEECEDDDTERSLSQTPEMNKEPSPGCSQEKQLNSVFKPIKEEPLSPNPYDNTYFSMSVKDEFSNKITDSQPECSQIGNSIKKEIKIENDKELASCSNLKKEIKMEMEEIKPKIENIKLEKCIKDENDDIKLNTLNSSQEFVNECTKKDNHNNVVEDSKASSKFVGAKRSRSPEENQEEMDTRVDENKKQKFESEDSKKKYSEFVDQKNIKSECLETHATNENSPAEERGSSSDKAMSSETSTSEISNQENKPGGAPKSPFVEFNKIKFRVGKRGVAKRQQYHKEKGTYFPEFSGTRTESEPDSNEKSPDAVAAKRDKLKKHLRRRCTTDGASGTTDLPDLTKNEAQCLEKLELLVRIISQITYVKEAIGPVCREFVPRIIDYLSTTQVIHPSAIGMLVLVAKNSLSIQPLLDTNFIPFVGVEFGEAENPEAPNGCSQCKLLVEGAKSFMYEMTAFFNHIHMYGNIEVTRRLHPDRKLEMREGCVMAIPHVVKCPKLLHNYMLNYPALDVLMGVLQSDKPPNDASYMYATAALSKLCHTLHIEYESKPQICLVCANHGNHTREEALKHLQAATLKKNAKLKNQNMPGLNQVFDRDIPKPTTPSKESASIIDLHKSKIRDCPCERDENRNVTFKMDDGKLIKANRELLSEKCDVLNGMLQGSFSESSCEEVKIPNVCSKSMEMLVHFLYGCNCDILLQTGVQTFLDLIFVSQMYFVTNLRDFAMEQIIKNISSGEDIINIFESGVGRIDEDLVLQSICAVLVRPMKTWKRARWMKAVFQSPHSKDIEFNIRMMIHHPLDLNRLVCNCDPSQALRIAKS